MLGRAKKAREQFHPVHRALIDGGCRASLGHDDLVALAASLAAHDATQRHPLPPRVVDVVVPLVRVLQTDLAPGGRLDLAIDVRGPDTSDKTTPRQDVPVDPQLAHRRVRRVREKRSVDPWFAARAPLRDRSTLEVSVVGTVIDRKVLKVGASGKLKWKQKVRHLERVQARLVLPSGRVVVDPGGTPTFVRVTTRPGGRHPVVVAKARFDLGVPPPMPYLQVLLVAIGEPFRWAPTHDQFAGSR